MCDSAKPQRPSQQETFSGETQVLSNDAHRRYDIVITRYWGISTATRKLAEQIPWFSEDYSKDKHISYRE